MLTGNGLGATAPHPAPIFLPRVPGAATLSTPNGEQEATLRVRVNGEVRDLPAGCTVLDLLSQLGIGPGQDGVAVAVNDEVISRTGWPTVRLDDEDRVEVVQAVQGGSEAG